jgi:hypothetical protein
MIQGRHCSRRGTMRWGRRPGCPGPAEPLVTLRTIGWNGQKVPPHTPHDIFVELVQQVMRGLEASRAGHVSVYDDGGHVSWVYLPRPAINLRVAEAVEREAGLPRLSTCSAQHVMVGGGGVAQRPHAEFAVFEDFGVAERNDCSLLTAHPDPEPADKVLAEVQDGCPGGRGQDFTDRKFLDPAYRRGCPGGRDHLRVGARYYRLPVSIVELRCRPAGHFQAGVVRFPLVEAACRDRGRRPSGVAVGDDGLGPPV